jgi:NADPH:quinone reductase-like Zn-dependent oxidoreductase
VKAVQIECFGEPSQVAACVDLPDPGPPGPKQVRVSVLAAPINPADLLFCQGAYADRPDLPAVPGAEAVGRIDAVGDEVDGLSPGQLVTLLRGGGTWQQIHLLKPGQVMPLPENMPIDQAAMLMANPATALSLLEWPDAVPKGSWVVQNAANSAVGRHVIRLAKANGVKTVNLVRRSALVGELEALGADAVLVDVDPARPSDDLAQRIRDAAAGGTVVRALDAVGGGATAALANALDPGGTVVAYGVLSGEPSRIDPRDLIFRDIDLRGFWMATWFRQAGRETITGAYGRLIGHVMDGTIAAPVDRHYPADQVQTALDHAAGGERNGKVLLTWPGYEDAVARQTPA